MGNSTKLLLSERDQKSMGKDLPLRGMLLPFKTCRKNVTTVQISQYIDKKNKLSYLLLRICSYNLIQRERLCYY